MNYAVRIIEMFNTDIIQHDFPKVKENIKK